MAKLCNTTFIYSRQYDLWFFSGLGVIGKLEPHSKIATLFNIMGTEIVCLIYS